MDSGFIAARVLGVTSAKTRITMVKAPVARAMPESPQSRSAITVAIDDDRMLTKLLPIRITPINRSGRSSRLCTLLAVLLPLLAMCRKRYRLSDIMPVSELEKNAEHKIRIKSAPPKYERGISFK